MNISRTVIDALAEWGLVKENEKLSGYTTYRTGGPADLLVLPSGKDAVPSIVKIAAAEKVPLTVIGGGSNLLVGDCGIEGIVLRICDDGPWRGDITAVDGGVYADAIVPKERFVDFTASAGYAGMEFMAGIPGCIGGGIMMNAGTYMGTFSTVLRSVDVVDSGGAARSVSADTSMSAYRTMRINGGAIITGARFALKDGADPAEILRAIEDIRADRRKKHPLDYPSAGSVFKNPPDHSSWKLIDDAGLKGRCVGGARVSDLHTNFIINAGGATSRNILDLITLIQETVSRLFGIMLETEIKLIGTF